MTDQKFDAKQATEELEKLILVTAQRRDHEFEVFKLGFEYGNIYQIPRGDTLPDSTMRALFETVKEVLYNNKRES